MQKKTAKKEGPAKPVKEKIKQAAKAQNKQSSSKKTAAAGPVKKQVKNSSGKKASPAATKKESSKPGLRSVYSNSRHTLLPLGFATDFKTKKQVVIFSDLATGLVHTIALSVWNRWKLKEVKKINTET